LDPRDVGDRRGRRSGRAHERAAESASRTDAWRRSRRARLRPVRGRQMKMHADEVHSDAALVRRLLAEQFPDWAGLPVEPVRFFGTDNAIYRLGEELSVRLPRREHNVRALEKERIWLPRLAPQLPLAVPLPLAAGKPGAGYPFD